MVTLKMTMIYNLIAASCFVVLIVYAWRFLDWIWFKPKKLEKILKQQGFRGNAYSLLVGDLHDGSEIIKEANSKPINLDDDIMPRVIPIAYNTISKYGMIQIIQLAIYCSFCYFFRCLIHKQ